MIYLILIVLILCLIYHYDYQKHSYGRREWYWGLCGFLIILAGLRYRLGIDTVAYEYSYDTMPDLFQFFGDYDFSQNRYGIAYLFVCAICRSITHSFVLLQFVEAAFVNIAFFYFFKRYTKNIFFAILLYFIAEYFNYSYEVLREGFAVGIFLLSWKYFLNNKWLKYLLCCIIAILFHPSALVMLLVPFTQLPLINRLFRLNKIFLISALCVAVVFAVISVIFFDLIQLISLSQVEDYANSYANSKYGEEKQLNIIGLTSFAIKSIFYPMAAAFLLSRDKSFAGNSIQKKDFLKLQSGATLNIYFAIGSLFIMILYRFAGYFLPFIVLLISDSLFIPIRYYTRKIRLSFSIWMIAISPFLVIYAYSYMAQDGESGVRNLYRYFPYESVLDPTKNPNREKLYRFYDR